MKRIVFFVILGLIVLLSSCDNNSNSEDYYITKLYSMHYSIKMPILIGSGEHEDVITAVNDDGTVGQISGIICLHYKDVVGVHDIGNYPLVDFGHEFLSDTILTDWFCIRRDREGRLSFQIKENNSDVERILQVKLTVYPGDKEYEGRPVIEDFELRQNPKR